MSTAIDKIKTKPLTQVTTVKEMLWNDQARAQLQQVAAQHMRPERMMRLMANAIRSTPKLGECDPMSLLGGMMTCAGLGLEPNTVLGHAYLIPFKNSRKNITEVQVVIGYKGMIDLARRSGHITSISAHVHYSDDELWEYEEGTEARLRHIPGPQEGQKLHAYAIARFVNGGHAYVVLPWAKVMKIRDGSQGWQNAVRYGSKGNSPWFTHEDEMASKTAVRALAKYLPLSVEFIDAISVDDERRDYSAIALDPTAPLEMTDDPEGETIEGEAQEPQGSAPAAGGAKAKGTKPAQQETRQEPAQNAEGRQDRARPARQQANEDAPPAEDEDSAPHAGLVARIIADLSDAQNADEADAALSLWVDQIETLSDEHKKEIYAAADAASTQGEE